VNRSIYIETSVVSYLTARPSQDSIIAACQQITRLWWDTGRRAGAAYISPYVIEEASNGDPDAAEQRLAALRPIAVLPVNKEIPELAEFLLLGGGLPAKARIDALHIACGVSSNPGIADLELHPYRQPCPSTRAPWPVRGAGFHAARIGNTL